MKKYQFHIAFNDKPNTAASKAVQDCKSILSGHGYQDFSIEDIPLRDKFFLPKLIARFLRLLINLDHGSLMAVQYPLLSGNRWFKYLIRAARLKNVRFLCIIHDVDDLRYPDKAGRKSKDIEALNEYDFVIAHNHSMEKWLIDHGLTSTPVVLHAFDYLSVAERKNDNVSAAGHQHTISFAGNLAKSKFLYSLDIIKGWKFNLYGPNYQPGKANNVPNICWNGSLSPDEVLRSLKGSFGLVWDGDYIDRLDPDYGNYLRFNYPHKLSLYLAAGMPVIAPRESAVSSFIEDHQAGVLVNDLLELADLKVDAAAYQQMKENAAALSHDFKTGRFFSAALSKIEQKLSQPAEPACEITALVTE